MSRKQRVFKGLFYSGLDSVITEDSNMAETTQRRSTFGGQMKGLLYRIYLINVRYKSGTAQESLWPLYFVALLIGLNQIPSPKFPQKDSFNPIDIESLPAYMPAFAFPNGSRLYFAPNNASEASIMNQAATRFRDAIGTNVSFQLKGFASEGEMIYDVKTNGDWGVLGVVFHDLSSDSVRYTIRYGSGALKTDGNCYSDNPVDSESVEGKANEDECFFHRK